MYVSAFYEEGSSPVFDEGIKNYINSNSAAREVNGTIAAVFAMGDYILYRNGYNRP